MAMSSEARNAPRPDAAMSGRAVADVARRVGVATSTLRAWERRYGLGPSGRTRGGHRRYSTTDVARLQQLERLVTAGMPTAEAAVLARQAAPTRAQQGVGSGLGDEHRDTAARRFAAASDALDSVRLVRTADAVLAGDGATHAWLDVFAPQLRALGARWECAGDAVEREHLTSSVVQAALARHAARHWPRQPRGGMVLTAATATEEHTLPLYALAAALAELRLRTCVLGGLPLPALHTAIADTAATAVVLWSHTAPTSDVPALRSALVRAPVACAAGLGWSVTSLPPGVSHLTDLHGALDTVTALLG
jgi:MerR family transcriptional regulator, light-induced transcriptional regulator